MGGIEFYLLSNAAVEQFHRSILVFNDQLLFN